MNLRKPRHSIRTLLIPLWMILALCLATVVAAQTTGRIKGQVRDTGGGSLPGVSVSLESPSLPGGKTFITESDGEFLFLALPPGVYKVQAQLEGFAIAEQPGVKVNLGGVVELSLELSPGVEDQIVVMAETPVLDFATTTTGATFNQDLIQKIPVPRDYQGIAFQAPGVVVGGSGGLEENNPSIGGASLAENRYIIDGLDTTDPAFGTNRDQLAFEFIQEVQVKTGGYQAEYGGALGGVLNIVTKSGGNEIKGDVFAYYDDDSLQSESPPTARLGQDLGFTEYDYGVDVGGKLIEDRLWYFAALNPRVKKDSFTNQGGQAFDDKTEALTYAGKLTWQVDQSNQVQLSVFGDDTDRTDNGLSNSLGFFADNSDDAITNTILRYDGVLRDAFLVEASIGRYDLEDTDAAAADVPRYEDRTNDLRFARASGCSDPSLAATNVRFANGCVGGTQVEESNDRSRDSYQASLSWFGDTGPVSHDVKVGFERRDVEYVDRVRYPGPAPGRAVDGQGLPIERAENGFLGQRYSLRNGFFYLIDYRQNSTGNTEESSAFLQDTLRLGDHFTLNLGLRATESVNQGDRTAQFANSQLDFGFSDMLAPRIGFTWDVARNGRSKVFGHFGRFYESVPLDINVRAFGNELFEYFAFSYPEDGSLPAIDNLGDYLFGFTLGSGVGVQEDIKPTYTEQVSLGFEYQLQDNLSVGLRVTQRELGDVIEDISVDGGNTYFVANPGGTVTVNPVTGEPLDEAVFFPSPRREYEAIELTVDRRYADGWQLAGSYVYSRNEGNYGGLFRQDSGQLDPNITAVFDLPGLLEGADGLLPNDREHQFKVYGSYSWPFELVTGFYAQYLTGAPLSQLGAHDVYGPSERFVTPRGTAGRTEDLWTVDGHAEFPISLRGGMKLRLIADVFNLLDNDSPLAVDQDWTFAAGEGPSPGECGGPGTGPGTACPLGNPNWGTPTQFQDPRTVRLGAKLSF